MPSQCSICSKTFTHTSKPLTCSRCEKSFHTTCTRLTTVLSQDGKNKLKVCSECLVAANTGSCRSRASSAGSLSDVMTFSSPSVTRTPTPTPSSTVQGGDVLNTILDKLSILDKVEKKLDKLDSMESKINEIGARLTSMDAKITVLESRMDNISISVDDRFGDVETKISHVCSEQHELKLRIDGISVGASSSTPSEPMLTKIQELDGRNESLSRQLEALRTRHLSLQRSSDLVLGGLVPSEFKELKLAVFAVLSTLDSSFTLDDIEAVRPLRRTTVATTVASTTTVNAESITEPRHTQPSTCPLLVTMRSATLARAVITAKIKMGKLHTSRIVAGLLHGVKTVESLTPSLVNINEYLPSSLHRLKLRALAKAKDKKYNFLTFVRNGVIYARKKKEDNPTPIFSDEDLTTFLMKITLVTDEAVMT